MSPAEPRSPAGRVLAVALICATAAPAAGHDFWIEALDPAPRPGALLAVRLRVGDHFPGETVARNPRRLESFVLRGPGGTSPVPGVVGAEPAGVVRLGARGDYALSFTSRASRSVLPADRFESYLREVGLERVIEARAAAGESASPGREAYSRSAKALFRVGASSAASADRLPAAAALGLPLELIAESRLHAMPVKSFAARLLFRGKPLAGALVTAARRGGSGERLGARTDSEGRVRLELDRRGFWRLAAVHMVRASGDEGVDWRSYWASLTFDSSAVNAGPAGQ